MNVKLPLDLTPITEGLRSISETMRAIRDSVALLPQVAETLGRKPQSLSPARDGLIKKGLVYSSERGTVAFTVPHFGKFLRAQHV